MTHFYWVHTDIDGAKARWHLVYDRQPGLYFVDLDIVEEFYDIAEYQEVYPAVQIEGPVLPPVACTCGTGATGMCAACSSPGLMLIARIAYRMGRGDASRYVEQAVRHVVSDHAVVLRYAARLWELLLTADNSLGSLSSRMPEGCVTSVQKITDALGRRILDALEDAPGEPVDFKYIVRLVKAKADIASKL